MPHIDETMPTITFMIATNLDKVRLQLCENTVITISENELDKDLAIHPKKLSTDDSTAWARFLGDRVRKGIKIKFCLHKYISKERWREEFLLVFVNLSVVDRGVHKDRRNPSSHEGTWVPTYE